MSLGTPRSIRSPISLQLDSSIFRVSRLPIVGHASRSRQIRLNRPAVQPCTEVWDTTGGRFRPMPKMISMTCSTRARSMLLVSAIVTAVGIAGAQQSAIPANVLNATLGQTVPVDPLITVGTLPNGLRYYIRENRQPQGRPELRLAVNAGSVLEDEEQRGGGHFVEAMRFHAH